MKYILLGILGWVSFFVIFAGVGLIFTIAGGMYDKEEIYLAIESGALISTALVIIGYVLSVAIPIANAIIFSM